MIAIDDARLKSTKSNFRGAEDLLIAVFCNFLEQRLERWMFFSRAMFAWCLLLFRERHDNKTGTCDQSNALSPVVTCVAFHSGGAAFISSTCNSSSSSEWTVQRTPIRDPAACTTIALANWTPWATPQITQSASKCCGCVPRRGQRSPHIGRFDKNVEFRHTMSS